MITFIVTTYNLEDWLLHRCLDSIVAQGLPRDEYEIIVVDDESLVSPQHVVDRYAALSDISLYVQNHNRQGAARNLGIRHAKGEWIQFVDGDDYLFAGTIPPLLRSAEAEELDLLMFGFREVHDDLAVRNGYRTNSQFSTFSCQFTITTGNDYMLHHHLFGSCCMLMFRRSLLDMPQYGLPLRFAEGIYIEDEEFVTKLVWRAQRMARADVPVYAYYQRTGSTVHGRNREHTDELFRNYFVVVERLLHFESSLGGEAHDGVIRKVRFLGVDILRRSLREPDWKERWAQSARQLHAWGLYPIPLKGYSWKYVLFALLSRSGVGHRILRLIEKKR